MEVGSVAAAESHPLQSTSKNEVAVGKVPTPGPWTWLALGAT